ncbi:MAG: hypothetical protein AB7P49_21610, partial [Bdellovibrionales bacterium]
MILYFPDLNTLQIALMTGAIPRAISPTPVQVEFPGDGSVYAHSAEVISRPELRGLGRLGVQAVRGGKGGELQECLCWAQIFPLVRESAPFQPSAQVHVLFQLPDSKLLPTLAGEVLRLGNDRQSFRILKDREEQSAALLRVIGPSYYTLLRALDREDDRAPRAYLEAANRLWVEVGYTHPLLEVIQPPEGKLLLLGAPQRWEVIEDKPFRDIYDILEFPLAHAPLRWRDSTHLQRLQVPLHLVPISTSAPAELWVIRENAVEQMEQLVRTAGDNLMSRLMFAVVESGDETLVVLRSRPSRQKTPVLVVEGEKYRPFLKLPNLFVPIDRRLQPPLRRDVVRQLLAAEETHLTWLRPHEDGTFTPETLPEQVFRLAYDWVEYILTREKIPLQAW